MAGTSVSVLDIRDSPIIAGPVLMDPFISGSANLFPKMPSRINDDSWELWEFEAFSDDGETAVGVSLYRDLRGLDQDGFHAELNAIWPDGSKWGETLYFAKSVITAEGSAHSHEGRLSGTMNLHRILESTSNQKTSLPVTEEAALLYPSVYYTFPMGPQAATVDLTFAARAVGEEGRKLYIGSENNGHGGMVRGWSSRAWPEFMNEAYYAVAHVGPYMLQLLRVVGSAAAGHMPHAVARLYRDHELVCAANHVLDGTGAEAPAVDTIRVEKILPEPNEERQEAGLAGAFRDKNVGYIIEFSSAQQQRHWRFEARHKHAWWSEPTSAPGPDGTGKSGWVEALLGGSKGEAFNGTGVGGQLQIPVP
ncbi:uncharacterized protein ACLA_023410 [Aspergillus clavatus NRRL 1]|uniref:Uncharacterized protein n=1 Tax=Aspergillus clavatus (strain ATCC 1007 / CBS 513.65 / DSM 816 / NCTC 3887 / NRRL 1 / QM 1276 / 107) TaxID=344612 RepID=A1CPQ6_ASPCL|nr:uncharacterized protein ACLA_023410 [Aspergillus clavatus NRRL 1]EAW07627.1 hypothetical protein ACLA_023410 [Aspergillus clavatus NRRL 1]